MRIISGKYKGRKIDGYDIVGTRPTMDRVKESLFAMINGYVKDANCLDLFAGSGSLGLEALSNGAKSCYFVDQNNEVIKTLQNNINNIKIEEDYYLVRQDYLEFLKKVSKNNQQFDLIFLDPPYKEHIIENILTFIYQNNLLSTNGLIICEYEFQDIYSNDFTIYKEKIYGTKKIKIFKKKNN